MGASDENHNEQMNIQKAQEFPVAFPMNYPQQQEEEEVHLRDYLHILLRRKWTAITFLVITVTTVLIGTFMTTPVYRSSVTIKIDKENPNVLQFKDVIEVEKMADDYYQTQYKILKSRNLAKRVIRTLKLDRSPEFAAPKRATANAAATAEENPFSRNPDEGINPEAVNSFLSRLTVEPQQKSMLVKVSFDSRDPVLSAKVANTIAKSYIDFNIESKFDATQQAREWLEKQLDEMKARVEKAEEALNKYAAQNGIIFLEAGGGAKDGKEGGGQDIVTQKLSELSSQLTQATSDRISKEAVYRDVAKGDPESTSPVMNNPLVQGLKKDYAAADTDYSQLLKVYKPEYPKMVRLKEQMNQIRAKIDAEAKKTVSGIRRDYETALKREAYLKSTLDKYKGEALNLNEKMIQYQILKRETDTNRELYNGLLQRLKETGISASLTSSNIQILDRAEVPRSPYKPKKKMNFLIALLTGLFGGIGLAFFVEYLDNTVKNPGELEKAMSLPSLGIVPSVEQDDAGTKPMLTSEDRKSPLSEAYRSIGTYIQFSSAEKPPKTMLVTSARKGEGKTTTAINTAITMARSSGKGLIIDADMRKPELHKIFDVDPKNGLSSFLTGHIEFGGGLIKKTKVGNLDVIPAGVIPPNPSELLSSYRMRDLMNGLFTLYSFIIIDSPPLLGLSDSLILSTLTDGVIVVVRAGETPKDLIAQSKKLLYGVNAKVLGVVLNGIRESDLRYGSYSYYYSYYYEDGDHNGKKRKRRARDRA